MRYFVLATALLSLALPAAAQTPSFKLQWDQAEAVAVAQSYQYTLKVDTGAAAIVPATCVVLGAGSRCTSPLASLASGPHVLTLTAFNGFGSATSDPLSGAPPSKPTSVTVTVIITVP